MSTLTIPLPALRPRLAHRVERYTPVLLGALATAVMLIGAGVPSLWGDEAASVLSAQRSWGSLFEMARTVDVVHLAYYAVLHVWIDLFGPSAFSVRVPSAIAVGVTVAGVCVLTRMFTGARTAVLAAALTVLVPRVGWIAIEARSAAIVTAIATWLTVLVVRAVRSSAPPSRRTMLLYAAGLLVSTVFFLYSALIVVAHAAVLFVFRASRVAWRRWAVAVAIAGAVSLPFVAFSMTQRGQIAFLARRDVTSPAKLYIEQWFAEPSFAVVAWLLIALAVAWAVWSTVAVARRGADAASIEPRDASRAQRDVSRRRLVVIAATWLLAPMALLLIADKAVGPLYTGRYVSFCAPAAAILIVLGITSLRPWFLQLVALGVVVAVAVPIAVAQRGPYAKYDNDWRSVSEYVGAHSEPGDGVVFDEGVRPSRKPRLAMHLYPEGFANTTDLGIAIPYDHTGGLWDVTASLDEQPGILNGHDRVWVIARSKTGTADDVAALERAGFAAESRHRVHTDVVTLYERVGH